MNNKFCQSCAMPLNDKQDMRGSEKDGSKSEKYCAYCYCNGHMINPNITYEEMLQKGLSGIDADPGNKFKKWMIKKSYPMMLKKCERWNNAK